MIKDFTLGYLKANPINWMLNTVGNSGRKNGKNIGVYAPGENKYQIGSFKLENVETDQDNAYVFSESQGYKGNAKINRELGFEGNSKFTSPFHNCSRTSQDKEL